MYYMDAPDIPGKTERIQIRCTKQTLVAFKEFAAGYSDQEAAIRDAVSTWKEYPSFFGRLEPQD